MNEQDIERGLAELKRSWRAAGEPPLDKMWEQIEERAFTAPAKVLAPRAAWTRTLLPLAAMLLLGFGIGQLSPRMLRAPAAGPDSAMAALATDDSRPFVGVATDYLEQVTALLVTVVGTSHGQPVAYSTSQARDLLGTTRLLMDTPKPIDSKLRALLEDLELVLAQIARLPARPDAPDVYLIDQALDQRDVIPRLRVFLAETPTSTP